MFNTTLVFSNVPGPMEEISFYGHPIAYIAPGVYGQPHVSVELFTIKLMEEGIYFMLPMRIYDLTHIKFCVDLSMSYI